MVRLLALPLALLLAAAAFAGLADTLADYPTLVSPYGDTPPVPATDPALLREVAQACREVKARIDRLEAGKRTVAVGNFTSPTNTNATGGALLKQLMTEGLKKAGVEVKDAGGVGLSGKFRNVTDGDSGFAAVKITFELEDADGEKVGSAFSHAVVSERVVAELFGATAPFAPGDDRKGHAVALARSITRPSAHVEGTCVASHARGRLAVEILKAENPADDDASLGRLRYSPLTPRLSDGLAVVGLRRKQFYLVRLINAGDRAVAALLSVDGVSMFTLSEQRHGGAGAVPVGQGVNSDEEVDLAGQPLQGQLVVAAGRHVNLKGWFLTPKKTSRFQVGTYGESVAAGRGVPASGVGTVTAVFYAFDRPKARPPAYSGSKGLQPVPYKGIYPVEAPATKAGQAIPFEWKTADGTVGAMLGAVSVRYKWAKSDE